MFLRLQRGLRPPEPFGLPPHHVPKEGSGGRRPEDGNGQRQLHRVRQGSGWRRMPAGSGLAVIGACPAGADQAEASADGEVFDVNDVHDAAFDASG